MANGFDIEILRRRALQRSRQLAAVTGNPIMARRQLETELTGLNRGFAGANIEAERIRYANELAQKRLGLQERQVGLGESIFEEQKKAAKGKQLGQSLTGLAQLGLAGKELGLFGGGTTAAQQLTTGAGVGAGAGAGVGASAGGISPMMGGGAAGQGLLAGTTPLTLPPTTAGIGGVATTTAGVGTASGAGGVGTGVGAGTAQAGVTGATATIGGVVGTAGVGYGVGTGARALIAPEGHRGGERYTAAGTGLVGGAISGAVVGTYIFPVIGTAIGAIVGGLAGLVGGGK